jgi:hypothetical protein
MTNPVREICARAVALNLDYDRVSEPLVGERWRLRGDAGEMTRIGLDMSVSVFLAV